LDRAGPEFAGRFHDPDKLNPETGFANTKQSLLKGRGFPGRARPAERTSLYGGEAGKGRGNGGPPRPVRSVSLT